jgi:hypothetical protein
VSSVLRLLTVLVALYALFPGARPADAQRKKDDILYLKDGRVLRGTIVEQLPNAESLLIRLYDGSYLQVAKADIARITQGSPLRRAQLRPEKKNPALAWGLSFLIPGAGQIYNGDLEKGVGAIVLIGIGARVYISGDRDACGLGAECSQQRTLGLLLVVATWLAAQIDAPLSARAINRSADARMSLDLGPEPHRLGISLAALRF